jgi:hypothetical protein
VILAERPLALDGPVPRDGKETVKARMTVQEVAELITALGLEVEELEGRLSDQLAELEKCVDELESGSGDRRKVRSRNMTDEGRKAAGERMQMGRAKELGLASVGQLRARKLRPGEKPTKAQITKVKKEHPAA